MILTAGLFLLGLVIFLYDLLVNSSRSCHVNCQLSFDDVALYLGAALMVVAVVRGVMRLRRGRPSSWRSDS
jgi:hypothetical protein